MNSRDIRRTVTLSQQLTMEDSDSPDHFIIPTRKPIPTFNNNIPARSATGHWDGASLRSASGRTLFDIINQDDNWKPVKDRLRLQRAGAAFSESPTSSDGPPSFNPMERAPSSMMSGVGGSRMPFGGAPSLRRTPTLARSMTRSASTQPGSLLATGSAPNVGEIVITEITDVTDEDEKDEEQAKEESGQGGVSLMALLEQTDTHWGDDGPEGTDELNYDDDDEGCDDDGDGEGLYHTCCVCMVRHKGAAFIPCGHTFCRLCSRELWVSRGNCPLCNGFIQEILDIF
ncbi:hypothetical protein LUZ63_003875 [Rhynchospora breviuscula]|uniref:RING-type domain-containing protein n=1 Tax=Rhynchospora breviuscula TaxID=2022672 RepID=A0A9Q0HZF0_9POAL|nr:hypothetical protein LUZ63_003875 [Rhynchospora breviuscula]